MDRPGIEKRKLKNYLRIFIISRQNPYHILQSRSWCPQNFLLPSRCLTSWYLLCQTLPNPHLLNMDPHPRIPP